MHSETEIPRATDTVKFTAAGNTSSLADITAVAGITIEAGFTKTIYVTSGGLTATTSFSMADGSFGRAENATDPKLKVLNIGSGASVASWTGGTFKNIAVDFGSAGNSNTTITISGTSKKSILSSTVKNFGSLTWQGAGSIEMSRTAVGGVASELINTAQRTFDIQSNATMLMSQTNEETPGGTFRNQGTLVKSNSGTTTFTALVYFEQGTVTVSTGGVLESSQLSFRQSGGTTRLLGGVVKTPGYYNITGGTLEGYGTLDLGTLTFAGKLVNAGGTVRPGIDGTPGKLIVKGGYEQTIRGTLQIDVASATSYSVLEVQQMGGQYGTATIAGTLKANLIGTYAPSNTSLVFPYLTYTSVTGRFGKINLPPSWIVSGSYYYFDSEKEATQSKLTVHQDPVPVGNGAIDGTAWYDADRDGVRDSGETLAAGITATLLRNVSRSAPAVAGSPRTVRSLGDGLRVFQPVARRWPLQRDPRRPALPVGQRR